MPAKPELEPAERERIYKLLHPDDSDLEPREEVLEYRVFAGKRRILLPSELDVANQRLKEADYRNTLERHEREKTSWKGSAAPRRWPACGTGRTSASPSDAR
jgi:hypothetical protein